MKAIKLFGFPLLIVAILTSLTPFQSCDPDDDDNECDTCYTVKKPNIYIYPTENIQLTVKLDFPTGGKIVTSIPEYGTGWNVSVDTNGLIDNYYTFLFYESKVPNIWQNSSGWIIKRVDLELFFKENMTIYGFYGNEIQDFIEYWIPKFNDFEYYYIYPQTLELIEDVIKLNFSKEPDNILRLFYVVKGFNEQPNYQLIEPKIETRFERNGFFITEWGVIIK